LSSAIITALAAWLEAGESRMGELLITGRYELRHYRDAGLEGLALHTRPGEARDIALYDACDAAGNYRPLKSAPTLRRGWRMTLRGIEELREALDGFYPAMLAARLALQRGMLDATPLRETLNRQSGMYAIAKKITDAQADAMIGEFCKSDGGCPGCLKTILWQIAPGIPITTLPRGKFEPRGDFPLLCAEACNLLVARAREIVKGTP
jgi:sirohydrochlorin cobaltochelatase